MRRFDNITVLKEELEYIVSLEPKQQLRYLFDLYEFASGNPVDLEVELEEVPTNKMTITSKKKGKKGPIPVDVLIDDEYILFESNSLKALRFVKYNFLELGYILSRSKETEKIYKDSKVTRYLRIYDIIGKIPPLSIN